MDSDAMMALMRWMTIAYLIATISFTSSHNVYSQMGMSSTGSCASFANRCCPDVNGTRCQAGDCMCNPSCRAFGDCCQDAGCDQNPTTCRGIGFDNQCCNDPEGRGYCDVFSAQGTRICSCNVSCHLRGDCCSDACPPRTCAEAGKSRGCCQWSTTSTCFVASSNCYCDSYCHVFGDCCSDVPSECRGTSQSWRSQQSRVQSALEREITASQIHNYHRQRGFNTDNDNIGYAHHRMALAARTQRVRGNVAEAREFGRGRAQEASRIRPPGPPPYYNY